MAWDNVKSQRLRTGITASIIAIGITALVGILTSVSALRSSMIDSFQSFGANVVTVYGGTLGPQAERPIRMGLSAQNRVTATRACSRKRWPGKGLYPSTERRRATWRSRANTTRQTPTSAWWPGDENYLELSGFRQTRGAFLQRGKRKRAESRGHRAGHRQKTVSQRKTHRAVHQRQWLALSGGGHGAEPGLDHGHEPGQPRVHSLADGARRITRPLLRLPYRSCLPEGLTAADAEFTDNVEVNDAHRARTSSFAGGQFHRAQQPIHPGPHGRECWQAQGGLP